MMRKPNIRINKKCFWIIPTILAIIVMMAVYSYWPTSRERMKQSIAIVENCSYYQIIINGKDTLYFNGLSKDSLLTDLSYSTRNIRKPRYSVGCWINKYALFPSCFGRLLTTSKDGNTDSIKEFITANHRAILTKGYITAKQNFNDLESEAEDLKYYLSVHDVQDEGFNSISQYSNKISLRKDSTEKTIKILSTTYTVENIKVNYIPDYYIIYRNIDNKLKREHCRQITSRSKYGFRIIQTDSKETPSYACPQHFHHVWPWRERSGKQIFIAAYGGLNTEGFIPSSATSTITAGELKGYLGKQAPHTITAAFAQDGSPAFSKHGFFLGVSYQDNVINTRQFHFVFNILK